MRRPLVLAFVTALGCGTADDPGGEGSEGGSSSSSGAPPASTTGPTTGVSASVTTDAASTSSSSAADSSSETSAPPDEESSSSGGCPLGTLDCACDGDACLDGLQCIEDVCAPPEACEPDLLEPNDDENMPTLLGEISDAKSDGGSIFGTLDGPDDVDWYRYRGDDDLLSNVNPSRFVKSNGGVRLCKFAECDNGIAATEFECPAETEAAVSDEGRPGCCAPMGIALGDANCDGVVEDNMQVFMRVDQAQEACVSYELVYQF